MYVYVIKTSLFNGQKMSLNQGHFFSKENKTVWNQNVDAEIREHSGIKYYLLMFSTTKYH